MRHLARLLLSMTLLSSGALTCSAFAQTQAPTPTERSRPPQIWIDPALGKLDAIALQDVSIDVRIEGFVASTTLDLTFFNPNTRVLEGEFVFPLADGQSITGYALEVNGKLREGVVVEKETARVAFESTTRRGIDPGLAELTRGNVFRTRLYLIPANGTKRVTISFDQPLLDAGAAWRYVLPLQFAQNVRHFKVHAEAIRAEQAPKSEGNDALHFDRTRDSFLADLERNDFRPEHELAFSIDKPAAAVTTFAVPDALDPAWRTFAAQVSAAAPKQGNASIHRIALFYDASGSARERDRKREFEFLDMLFAKLKDVDVDLVAFRNDADPVEHFSIHGGDASTLRRAIESLPLDGGTSYGAINLDAVSRPDLALVIGDGLGNFGAREPQLAFADGTAPRVVMLHAAQRADSGNFARWARRFGGQVVDLLQTDKAQALQRIGATPWMLQTVRVTQGECSDLAPATPAPASAATSVYGRCKGAAELDLQFGDAAGTSVHRTVKLDDAKLLDPERGAFVARLWAVARIADLSNAAQPDDAAITALAKRYGVVTQNTSMLVLDRVEDYVRYRVEPREPDLREQYQRLLAAQPKDVDAEQKKQRILTQVMGWWTDFKHWHDAPYPWLETVLSSTADAEIARWRGVVNDKDAASHARSAEKIAAHAKALRERWLREGADPQQRIAWEREATAVMLELDALRQQRLVLAPDSDAIKTESPAIASTVVQHAVANTVAAQRPGPMPEARMAAPPPPPADIAPGQPATPAAETGAGGSVYRHRYSREVVADEEKSKKISDGYASVPVPASIQLQEWDPNTPYLAILRAAKEPYAAYLQQRDAFGKSPAFYLDSADYFRQVAKDPRLALRVLSNLAEIDVESAPLLRVLAYRLEQWDRFELAVPLFEDALKLRGEEPQSYRDLALALTRQPQADDMRAVHLLWKVISTEWDGRFPEIQTIALHELDDVLARASEAERSALTAWLDEQGADHRLLELVPVDLRVVLTWDADNTDIDLWVIDPTGEVAIYSRPRTTTGGRVSRDFTGGYGPEVFTIRRPIPGTYTVKANYYGSRQQKVAGDVTVQVEFFTGFDTAQDKRQAVTRRLENKQQVIEIGRFMVGAK